MRILDNSVNRAEVYILCKESDEWFEESDRDDNCEGCFQESGVCLSLQLHLSLSPTSPLPLSCFGFYSPSIWNYIASWTWLVLSGSLFRMPFSHTHHLLIAHLTPIYLSRLASDAFHKLPSISVWVNCISQCSRNCIRIFILCCMVH